MNPGETLLKMAAFRVGKHECAIDIMSIKEIVNPLDITPLPRAPAFLEGVVELRGAIVPIVDLRKRFGIPAEKTPSMKYIIASRGGRIIGLIVDSVTEVINVPFSDLRPAPGITKDPDVQPVSAMCRFGGRLILVLDLNVMLSSEEKMELSAVEERT